jgi:hypothetical protein
MKTLIFLALGATALYLVAKRNNINSLQDLKDLVQPQLDKLMSALSNSHKETATS